jgi:hypothetical protein
MTCDVLETAHLIHDLCSSEISKHLLKLTGSFVKFRLEVKMNSALISPQTYTKHKRVYENKT